MRFQIFLISLLLSSSAIACNKDGEFKPFLKFHGQLGNNCNSLFLYVPNKLNTLELSGVTYTINNQGEVTIPSMFVDASNLDDLSAKGYSLSQLCSSKAKLDEIKVTVSYQPPVGDNGEVTFCFTTREFFLSELI